MKTYCGLEYSSKIKATIINTINEAKENIFSNYFFIVDDPLFFEEAFFKYTDTLFNIQIINYQDLINQLINNYQLHKYEKLTKLDKILITKKLIESSDNIFNNNNKMDLIYELINIFDLFYLEDITTSSLDNLSSLSKQKLATILTLYNTLIKNIPQNKCYQYEELLLDKIDSSLQNNHYIFITEEIVHKRPYDLIKQISKHSDVMILMNCNDEDRNFNIPFKQYHNNDYYTKNDSPYLNHLNTYLFSLKSPKYSQPTPLHSLIQTTPKAQIESVVLNIYQNIIEKNMHYHDFAIYYPNQEYLDLLTDTLNNFNIPHNIKKTLIFKELDACILLLKYYLTHNKDDLLNLLDTKIINGYTDYNYIDLIKKSYLETNHLEDPFESKYNFLDCHTLSDYCNLMISFIKNETSFSENQTTLINFFTNLLDEQSFTLNEFYNLVNNLKPTLTEDKQIYNDHVYLLNYNQCYSGILDCPYVYLVGVNETIVPNQIKDTGILLDNDYQTLNLPDLNYQIGLEQNNIIKILNSNTNFLAICFSNATIDGQPLLKSSLYEQLKQMFNFTKIDISKDYLHHSLKNKLYLQLGRDDTTKHLNNMIDYYKQSNNQPTSLTNQANTSHLSSSKIETYNSCPYKYFVQYDLKLYPFKQPTLQTNEIGSIVHYVLEKTKILFQNNQSSNDIDYNQLQSLINKYVDEYINDNDLLDKLEHNANKFIIKMIKLDLVNTIIVLINQMKVSDFKIVGSEVKICQQYPNFKLDGVVDRIDQYDKYLKIIDYKSSDKNLDISLAIQGFNIQMLLYLDSLTKQKKLEKGALLYFNTKKRILSSSKSIIEEESDENFFKLYKMNGYVNEEIIEEIDNNIDKESNIIKAKFVKKYDSYKGNILSSFSFERLLAYVNKHIQDLYQELISGNISISPKGSDETTIHTKVNPCNYCNYKSLCNFDIFYNEYTLVDTNDLEYLIKEENENAD